MKKTLFTIMAIYICCGSLIAQSPGLFNPNLNPSPLTESGTGTMEFTIASLTTAIPLSTGLTVNISFARSTPSGPPTGAGAAFFNWTYNAGLNTYQGVQNQEIAGGPTAGFITVPVDITGVETEMAGFNANLGNVAGLAMNDIDDDQVAVFAPIGSPLPVELISFTGKKVDDLNELTWTTASEENNAGFEIEKSEDGVNWEIIGWVEGRGTSNELNEYIFLDRLPFLGDNYYRLKQVDVDGQFEYSKNINIRNVNEIVTIDISPNPSPGIVKVAVTNRSREKIQVTIFDSVGNVVWASKVLTNLEFWEREFHLEQKEMYFATVKVGKEVVTEKILIVSKK